jgi:hypothetical protein
MGVDMGKNKKYLKKSKESNGYNSLGTATETFKNPLDGFRADYGNQFGPRPILKNEGNMNGDESDVKEEFDGSFSNPFADRELDYLIRQSSPKTAEELLTQAISSTSSNEGMGPYSSSGEGNVSLKNDSSGSDMVNIPVITDEDDLPEGDERMLNRLLFLCDYLNGKYRPSNVSDQEFEDMKWETINETYCLITVDLPRSKAEVVRKFFRRLDTTYAKQDGTYYSKVTKGQLAKEIIEDLIEVYPWNEAPTPGYIRVDTFSEESYLYKAKNDRLLGDKLKYAIGNLGRSVENLNEILSGK